MEGREQQEYLSRAVLAPGSVRVQNGHRLRCRADCCSCEAVANSSPKRRPYLGEQVSPRSRRDGNRMAVRLAVRMRCGDLCFDRCSASLRLCIVMWAGISTVTSISMDQMQTRNCRMSTIHPRDDQMPPVQSNHARVVARSSFAYHTPSTPS